MKFVVGSLLFVFFSMFMEDALFAHAGAEDLSPCHQETSFSKAQHEKHNSDSEPHRDICHFGHCSFLLIEPLAKTPTVSLPQTSYAPYVFSLKARWLEPSLRPPII